MLAKLRILQGRLQDKQGQNKRPEVKIWGPRFVMGSAADCAMCCRCSTVSAHHCELRVEQQSVVVRTLSHEKGTFVNDVLVKHERILHAGDHLRIGRLEFEVLIEESASVPSGERDSHNDSVNDEPVNDEPVNDESVSDVVAEAISDSMVQADERERVRSLGHPESRQLHLEPASAEAARTQAVQSQPSGNPGKAAAKAKPGKLPARPTAEIVAKDSQDAAQQALRKLFSR